MSHGKEHIDSHHSKGSFGFTGIFDTFESLFKRDYSLVSFRGINSKLKIPIISSIGKNKLFGFEFSKSNSLTRVLKL